MLRESSAACQHTYTNRDQYRNPVLTPATGLLTLDAVMTQPSQQAGPKDRPAALMSPMSQLTCDTLTQSATVPNHSGSVTILVFKYEHLIPVHLFEHRFRGWIGRDLRHLPTTTQTRGDRRPSAAASPLDDPARKPRLRGASPPPPPRRRSRTRVTMPCRRLSRSFWTDSASQVK